ncbi:MAG: helix-turn-helix transcriptional regulator [Candidatus Omnitrophica bacterium]|nr:helix-turn-helix transcriptional regulator [Candidatus Omnitrophota bacterium]
MDKGIAAEIRKRYTPKPDPFLDIGGVVLSFMEEQRVSGSVLAKLSGVSEPEVYNILKNRRTRSGLKTLQKLVAPLGKTLADIFNRLAEANEGNLKKLEKDPAFVMEFKKQGVTLSSDSPPMQEFFIGRISLTGGAKGLSSSGLKNNCWVFLRVTRGNLEVTYCGTNYSLSTYQKLVFNARYKHAIKNKSAGELAEALLVTAPCLWTLPAA